MNKKYVKILLGSALSLSLLAACGNNETNEEDPAEDNGTEEIVETEDGEESADEETAEEEAEDLEDKVVFEYLPEATADAKLIDHEEASDDQMEKAIYTIANAEAETVMTDYMQTLEDEGWEIVEDNSPELIRAAKDDQEVIIAVGQNEEDVTLTILSN